MDERNISERLDALERKLDATYGSAEKSRKYLLMIIAGSTAAFVLPLVGLLFAIPSFMGLYQSIGSI